MESSHSVHFYDSARSLRKAATDFLGEGLEAGEPVLIIASEKRRQGAVWLGRTLQLRRGMKFSLSGGLATMGSAIPYAIAAKFVHPDRTVIAVLGDGAMQMSGMNALIDVAKHWKKWSDPRLIVLVLNNRDLNYVTWEQRVMEGDPKFPVSQDLPDLPYAEYARMLGLDGIRIDSPNHIGAAWDQALTASRPFVIDAVVSAALPPLPPELQPEQEDKLAKALAEGDVDAVVVLEQMQLQDVVQAKK